MKIRAILRDNSPNTIATKVNELKRRHPILSGVSLRRSDVTGKPVSDAKDWYYLELPDDLGVAALDALSRGLPAVGLRFRDKD